MRLGILASHPIQYHAPWFRALAREMDLRVFFAHQPHPDEQAIGFGGTFSWDIDLLSGYEHVFLNNIARRVGTQNFFGCDTPDIAAAISRGSFDCFVVSGWNLKSYWQAIRACRKLRIPVLVRGDSQLGRKESLSKVAAKRAIHPLLLSKFDGFLSVGKRNREYLLRYGVPDKRIFFVPHFVDNDRFAEASSKSDRAALRSQWGVSEQVTVVLFVGKFLSKKRPSDIVDAVARLRQRGVELAAVFVGSGVLERELRSEAARKEITVRFEGFRNQTELPAIYAAADVLVLPSDAGETWGLVVNEAMACGLPAIVSEAVGCAPDMIDDGATGFTYPCGDVHALAGCLAEFVSSRQQGLSFRNGLLRKMRTYSVGFAAEQTIRALREVVVSAGIA